MSSRLLITEPSGEERTLELLQSPLTLGRSEANALSYPDERALSRKHAVFEQAGGRWAVQDLKSRNGTFVNGKKLVDRYVLSDGDEIRVASLRLVYDEEKLEAGDVTFDSGDQSATSEVTRLDTILARDATMIGVPGVGGGWTTATSALLRVGRELASPRPLAELFPVILDLAAEAVGAKRGVLLTLEDGELRVRARRGEDFRISSRVRDRVLNEKLSLIIRDVSVDPKWDKQESIIVQGIRSLMAVPLQTDERVTGLLYLDSQGGSRRFTGEDLELTTVMANIAAIRIEHARLAEVEHAKKFLENELRQAADIQRQCLPEGPPEIEGVDIAGFSEPCRTVGGDYYGYFPRPDGKLCFTLADVAGKGMPASLLVMNLQARMQALAGELDDPAELTRRLNDMLKGVCPSNRFVTVFTALLDPASGELTYCNAGHEPPLLLRAGGALERLEAGGAVVGLFPGMPYESGRTSLAAGDVLTIFSDGLSEAMSPDNEEFGVERIERVLREAATGSAAELLESLDHAAEEWLQGAPPHDDLTVVALKKG